MALFCLIHYVSDDTWGNHSNQVHVSAVQDLSICHPSQFHKRENQCHDTLLELFCQTKASFLHNETCTGVVLTDPK